VDPVVETVALVVVDVHQPVIDPGGPPLAKGEVEAALHVPGQLGAEGGEVASAREPGTRPQRHTETGAGESIDPLECELRALERGALGAGGRELRAGTVVAQSGQDVQIPGPLASAAHRAVEHEAL